MSFDAPGAVRLGSPLDPVIEIHDREGRRVAAPRDCAWGATRVLAFRVPTTAEYRLLVSNLSFHGGPQHV